MESFVFAAILLVLSQTLLVFSGGFMLWRYAERKQQAIEDRIADFIREWGEAPEPGKPSKAWELLGLAGAQVGRAAADQLMMSLQQANAHAGNVASGLATDMQAAQNPLMAMLSGGKRGKGAGLARLAEMLGPMLAGGSPGSASGNDGGRSHQFTL